MSLETCGLRANFVVTSSTYFSRMFVVDNFEHETEESSEYLVTVLKVQAHVERFHVRKILQQVKVSEKCMDHSYRLGLHKGHFRRINVET